LATPLYISATKTTFGINKTKRERNIKQKGENELLKMRLPDKEHKS